MVEIDRDQPFVGLELPFPVVRIDWWEFRPRQLPLSVVKELHDNIHVVDPPLRIQEDIDQIEALKAHVKKLEDVVELWEKLHDEKEEKETVQA